MCGVISPPVETARPYIIALDGRSGAGKTQFAAALATTLGASASADILHLEDLYPGWDGLGRARKLYAELLPELAQGHEVAWQAWDWETNQYGAPRTFAPGPVLIIEGVGAAGTAARDFVDVSIWLDAPATLRRERALARDGETYRPYWQQWAAQETAYLHAEAPQEHVTIVLNAATEQTPSQQLRTAHRFLPAALQRLLPHDDPAPAPALQATFAAPADVAALFEAVASALPRAALLESTSHKLTDPLDRNRYSVLALALDPAAAVLSSVANRTVVHAGSATVQQGGEFFTALHRLWPPHSALAQEYPLPQWVGYLGYELSRELGAQDRSVLLADGSTRPDAQFFCPDALLVVDHRLDRLMLHCAADRVAALSEIIAAAAAAGTRQGAPLPALDFECADSANGYRQKVRTVQQQIFEGNTYEACLTTVLKARVEDFSPFEAYCRMRESSPAPFAHYLRIADLEVASISPERFLSLDAHGKLRAEPIKGTRPRGKSEPEDLALAHDLATHPKDRAENIMIVDLLRNDLSHYALPGTVAVKRLCAVETYATVHQMVSTIDARLRSRQDAALALREAFPPGSMTGAPKLSSMEILDELEEQRPRGLYSGAVGYLGHDGSADFSVVIRTLVCDRLSTDGWELSLGLGGAITADSDPQEEWEEVLTKSVGVLSALGTEFPVRD
ncbi:aminodeoxychorismate synthase, component I [Arthrobacter sp. MYb229]|nr:aminodeoxychorismate synthase, component I [Arthrobacter sp. MYb229]PRB52818.1 aminodeoxychorismate synthase, component I [Arthrobacter sp. MYb216]